MSAIDRRKLVGVLGMLGSAHDGERASAALKASDMLRRAGVTWAELIAPRSAVSLDPDAAHGNGWRVLAVAVLEYPGLLDAEETRFLKSILGWRKITPKQADWLHRIAVKVAAAGGSA